MFKYYFERRSLLKKKYNEKLEYESVWTAKGVVFGRD